MGEQLVVVCKLLDVMVPEQVIEVPKILCREPQMVDQLVTVLTVLCVFTRSPAPPMEDQLVEVPPIVSQLVGFFCGCGWVRLAAALWAYGGLLASHTQWAPPPGYTARPGRDGNTGRRGAG